MFRISKSLSFLRAQFSLFHRKKQSGRSMIEMLGVLVIIGVLSVAALFGFTYAMNKIKANNTLHDVNLWALRASETEQTYLIGQTIPTDDIGYKTIYGYDITLVSAGDNLFAVEVIGVPDKVCRLLLNMAYSSYIIETTNDDMGNGIQFNGKDISVCETNPTLYFYFDQNINKPTNMCLPACESNETCCNNMCYPTDGICGSLCACPDGTECKGDGLCCLPDSESCNGNCCPASQICMNGSCNCPEGAVLNEENQCVCPTGSMIVDNRCQSIICTKSGSNYTCTDIYGNRCGTGCNNDGSVCSTGLCQNDCQKKTIYTYDADRNYYGCKNVKLKTFCTHSGSDNSNPCYFYEQNARCGIYCSLNGEKCGHGSCQNTCPDDLSYHAEKTRLGELFGCSAPLSDIFCYLTGTLYTCFKNNIQCGGSCDAYGKNCRAGYCYDELCLNGQPMELFNNTWSCINDNGTYCFQSDTGYSCRYIDNSESCGSYCQNDGTNCSYGNCVDGCPEGFSFVRIAKDIYGCQKDGTNIACRKTGTTYNCYKNGIQCGSGCNIDGTICKNGTCLVSFECPSGSVLSSDGRYCVYDDIQCEVMGNACSYNGLSCGYGCTNANPTSCTRGTCQSSDCPAGTIFSRTAYMNVYGCVSTSSPIIACQKNSNGTFTCFKDNEQCGTTCLDYTGAGCQDCVVDEI